MNECNVCVICIGMRAGRQIGFMCKEYETKALNQFLSFHVARAFHSQEDCTRIAIYYTDISCLGIESCRVA